MFIVLVILNLSYVFVISFGFSFSLSSTDSHCRTTVQLRRRTWMIRGFGSSRFLTLRGMFVCNLWKQLMGHNLNLYLDNYLRNAHRWNSQVRGELPSDSDSEILSLPILPLRIDRTRRSWVGAPVRAWRAHRSDSNSAYSNCLHFSMCACHPCAGAVLIFSVSFQFSRMIPEGNPRILRIKETLLPSISEAGGSFDAL